MGQTIMKKTMSQLMFILLLTCFSLGLQGQVANSFYYPLKEKTIYMDSMRIDDLKEMAVDHYSWDNWEISTTIYNYLLSKNFISVDTSDTAHIGSWGHYMNLAHLRLIEHKYAEAKIFLVLSEKAVQPQFWCGNAASDIFNEKDAFDQECKLGMAPLNQKDKLLAQLFAMALYEESIEMNTHAGKCAVNYLLQFYEINQLKEILKKMSGTISVSRYNEYTTLVSMVIFNMPVKYTIYGENNKGGVRNAAIGYYLQQVGSWFPYDESEFIQE